MRIDDLNEKAPKGKKAKRFIRKAKKDFKDRYGDAWKQVLYATAWKLFKESALCELDAPSDVRSWLRGTQCVDNTGKPLVMYHGVPNDYAGFDKFSDNPMGHFFTSDPDYAARYAEKPIHDDPEDDTGALYPVYLSLKKPWVIDENDEEGVEVYSYHQRTAAQLIEAGYDGMMIRYADGEVEAMVVSADQIVSAVQARPQMLRESTSDKQDSLRAVMDAYRSWQPSNAPQCWIDFLPGDVPNELEIDSLEVEREYREQGQAKAALAYLCKLADQNNVTMVLMPCAKDDEDPLDNAIPTDGLIQFYQRFGFEWGETGSGDTMMIRHPGMLTEDRRLTEGLIAVPPAMRDHIIFLMTFHYLWWAKWRIKSSGQEWPELSRAIDAEAKKIDSDIPSSRYSVDRDISVTKIPVSVEGLPTNYTKLQPRVTSILFAIMWNKTTDLGGWNHAKNALVVYPEAIDYMSYWPSRRSHPEDISIAILTLKGTIDHELRHMMQYVFLGQHEAQRKYKSGYNKGGADYYTSPVEFDPAIGSIAQEFVSLYGIANEARPHDLATAMAMFVGARPTPSSHHIFSEVRFFKHMRTVAPQRYRLAVKKFFKEVMRIFSEMPEK